MNAPYLFLSCALLGCPVCALTNAPSPADNWVVRSWQTKDGLPQNTVYAIAQTRDGYLWVGTGGGLARFDGVRFRTFGLQDGLRSVQISALVETPQGELWVGTRGGGISRWEKGRFTTFSTAEGLTGSTVEALAAGKDGTVWIGTTRGLLKWSEGVFAMVGGAAGLPEKHIRAVLEDSRGVLWVSTFEALFRGSNGHFDRVQETASARTPVYSLCEDRAGDVWAGGGNGYLWRIGERTSKRFEQTNGVPFEAIECMAQGRAGPLWIGTREGGLYLFEKDEFQKFRSQAGVPIRTIRGLILDRDGGVWAGTGSEGLIRVSRKQVRVWGPAEGLEHRNVTSVAEDVSGALWASTQNGGVYRLEEGRFSRVKGPSELAGHPNAYTIMATGDGSIWAGGEAFLCCFERNGATRVYKEAPIGGEAIRALCAADSGVWLGTYYGSLLKADATGVHAVLRNGTLGGEIRSLVREGSEGLWIGTAAGLYHWKREKFETWTTHDGLLSAAIQTLHRDADGTLWIGTLGGGVARLREGHILNITTREGLVDDVISQIIPDDFGHLWLGCNRGIMRLERAEIEDLGAGKTSFVHALVVGQNEGMRQEQCSSGHSPTALKTSAGKLLFPTSDGLVEIDPRQWLDSPNVIPRATIEEVKVDGKIQELAAELILPPGSRHLEVVYAAPSLRAAESVHFRFRMEPLERNWLNAGARRTAYYTKLRPGRYVFRVTSAGTQGEWNEKSAGLVIIVKPFYWQTLWFQTFVGLAVVGAAFGWYFNRMVQLEHARAAQEKFTHQLLTSQENERKRLAYELHDGLGQDLLLIKNRIGLLAAETKQTPEVARQLADISTNAARAITDLRTMSHALRPSALEQVGLTKALEWMVQQVGEASTTKFSTELENIDGVLKPDLEMHLYRIVQEALNNVVKHARATEAIIEVKRPPGALWVSIFDNGQGFKTLAPDLDGLQTAGLGLAGIRERAKVLGGRVEVRSSLGKGTRVTLTIPVQRQGI